MEDIGIDGENSVQPVQLKDDDDDNDDDNWMTIDK